ncbi:mannose-1-phosphate guanylyltransferase [Hyphobacterium marinum]|uniref:Sugar phosphate nucleotidyltransferase n=1 Tax=Hyphobacterium marinum TaxID=3116574 RepID=A0ABU7LXZ9_9PROT|nr:sugar phosphate nucleotidyltransferase [Hyphobacterium sp. Y6023]MEE2566434.1 sugar phosphate nucleotidyltransferase [Hyphobacterium sp. Y6023]
MSAMTIRPAILCGGSGERLWPLSRKDNPKPFHKLVTGRTLFEDTLLRSAGEGDGVAFSAPLIVAGEAILDPVTKGLASAGVKAEAIALEPAGRNTAAAALLAARLAQQSDGEDALVLLAPSDHHIGPLDAFRRSVAKAARLAAEGRIVVFGIAPTRAETGYGYIRAGETLAGGFILEAFEEKPDAAAAQRYLDAGDRYWNAGLFAFRADVLIAEMARFEPQILECVDAALAFVETADGVVRPGRDGFLAAPSLPLDIAVMERTDRAAMVPAEFGWSDIGAWQSLADLAEGDARGVKRQGDAVAIDCADSYLRGEGVTVAALGVSGLTVVATPDAVLVADSNRAADIKTLLAELREQGLTGPL